MIQEIQKVHELQVKYQAPISKAKVTSSQDSFEIFRTIWDADSFSYQERMYALFLNRSNRIIGYKELSAGGISMTVLDIRLLFGKALAVLASGIILAHNHPSGNLKPSNADITLTQKVEKAGEFLEIMLLDHLILAEDKYYSFRDEGIF